MFFDLLNFILQNLLYFSLHLSQSSFPRPLSANDEKEYFGKMAKGDTNARDMLINHNLRLVAHIIKNIYYEMTDFCDHTLTVSFRRFLAVYPI